MSSNIVCLLLGELIGLKVANTNDSSKIEWMSCYPSRCKVTSCYDDSKGYPQCPPALFSLIKVHEPQSDICVGDLVVLRPHHNNQMIITCGRGVCRGRDYCPVLTTKKCRRHHLKILVHKKFDGQKVSNNDLIELRFHQLKSDSIMCNVDDDKCKRCSCHDCQFRPTFFVFKLLI